MHMFVYIIHESLLTANYNNECNNEMVIWSAVPLMSYVFLSTVKSHFIVARLNGESRQIKIEKLILILATFIF